MELKWNDSEQKYMCSNCKSVIDDINHPIFKYILSCVKYTNKEVNMDKPYFVVDWSHSPMCDGLCVYEYVFTYEEEYKYDDKKINIYKTHKSSPRSIFNFEIYETKEEADVVCDILNKFGYDYDLFKSKVVELLKDKDNEN